jgi:hypothetical protein
MILDALRGSSRSLRIFGEMRYATDLFRRLSRVAL